jgi:hypothetical protein
MVEWLRLILVIVIKVEVDVEVEVIFSELLKGKTTLVLLNV